MTLRECPLCLVEVADGKTTVCPFCGGKLPPAQGASNGNGWPRPVPETPRHAAPQASPAFDAGPIRRAFDARRIDVAADILERTRDVLGGRAGRLKRGTVLVLDVQGSEPGEVSAFVSESLAALARRGGLPAGLAGDAVAVVFGAPVAFDHDTQSALHAALEVRLQASMAPAGGASPFIRIGIATGPIHIEGTGDLSRFAGDALDAATELQHRAPMGGILLCDDTRRAAGSTVATLPVPGVTLPDGTGAWFLVEENGTPGVHGGRGEAPFCGRQEELGRLLAFLAGDSSAGVMHVVGEGGIGKSRLVREALARRPGLAVATWRAVDGGSAVLGGPILGWLREWMGLRDDTPPATLHGALGRLLRERFPTALSGAVLIEYLFGLPQAVALLAGMPADRIVTNLSALLRDMLVHLAGPGGSCVVVAEDIHRHDPVTRQVLQALGDGIGEGLLVVVTYRPGGEVPLEQRTRHEVLNLAPLQAAER